MKKIAAFIASGSGMGADAAKHLSSKGYEIGIMSSSGKGEELAKKLNGVGFTGSNLSTKDIEALKSELSDPRFSDGYWQDQIHTMLKLGKKAEQQSLAKYGLDFVTDTYLPEKLGELGLA